MNTRTMAAQLTRTFADGIRLAQERGKTLPIPALTPDHAADAMARSLEAISQEHGPNMVRVYEACISASLLKVSNGRQAFLTTAEVAQEVISAAGVTGDKRTVGDTIRPMLMQLAIDGPMISAGYGWVVSALSYLLPGERKATTYKGKAPEAPRQAPQSATDRQAALFGRQSAPVTAAPIWGQTAAPVPVTPAAPVSPWAAIVADAEAESSAAPVVWTAPAAPAPAAPAPAELRAASVQHGARAEAVSADFLTAATVASPAALTAALTRALTPEVLTGVLRSLPLATLTAVLEAATAPAATPAAPKAKRTRKAATATA